MTATYSELPPPAKPSVPVPTGAGTGAGGGALATRPGAGCAATVLGWGLAGGPPLSREPSLASADSSTGVTSAAYLALSLSPRRPWVMAWRWVGLVCGLGRSGTVDNLGG